MNDLARAALFQSCTVLSVPRYEEVVSFSAADCNLRCRAVQVALCINILCSHIQCPEWEAAPVTITLNGSLGDFPDGDSLMICSTRSSRRRLNPLLVQDLLKPLCTSGRRQKTPLLGRCVTRQAYTGHHDHPLQLIMIICPYTCNVHLPVL